MYGKQFTFAKSCLPKNKGGNAMENASKALIIAGAILLSILIIAVGMFIFTSSQTTIQEGATQISTQERNAYNQQFIQYEKKQGGANIGQLIQILIANCNSNQEEKDKLPDLVLEYKNGQCGYVISDNNNTNVGGFSRAKSSLESRHSYYVTPEYNPTTSLVDLILVEYEPGNATGKGTSYVPHVKGNNEKAYKANTAAVAGLLQSSGATNWGNYSGATTGGNGAT
jgi:hypothetical protein